VTRSAADSHAWASSGELLWGGSGQVQAVRELAVPHFSLVARRMSGATTVPLQHLKTADMGAAPGSCTHAPNGGLGVVKVCGRIARWA
jgi:acetyl-CoA carboxylase carboxyltransferase component